MSSDSDSDSDSDFSSNVIKKRNKILRKLEAEQCVTETYSCIDDCILIDDVDDEKNDDSILDISLNERKNKRKGVLKNKPSKRGRKMRQKQDSTGVLNNDDSVIEIISEPSNTRGKRSGKTSRGRGRGRGRGKKTSIGGGNEDTSTSWYFNHKSPPRDQNVSKRIKEILEAYPPLSNRIEKQNNDSDDSIIEIIDEENSSKRKSKGTNKGKKTPRNKSKGRTQRGRALRSQNRNQLVQALTSSIPTYSVGNTEEYEDELEDVPLFSLTQTKNKNISLNNIQIEDNEELSVKVYWQQIDIFKFNIRKFQKLKEIFEFFSEKENIPIERLLFTYNDCIIKQDDTPDSIDYNIAKFIDGGYTTRAVNIVTIDIDKKIKTSGVRLKFQVQKPYKPVELFVGESEKLSLAMVKCAEHLELPFKKLKFVFDGDVITGLETLKDLEMEGDECIDVKIID